MADVQGVRYAVSGAVELPGIEANLTPYAEISRANSSAYFADNTALAIDGVDPSVLLVVRSSVSQEDPGPFRELWSMTDDPFPVGFCQFMEPSRRATQPECGT
jgi:hypothetical protein